MKRRRKRRRNSFGEGWARTMDSEGKGVEDRWEGRFFFLNVLS